MYKNYRLFFRKNANQPSSASCSKRIYNLYFLTVFSSARYVILISKFNFKIFLLSTFYSALLSLTQLLLSFTQFLLCFYSVLLNIKKFTQYLLSCCSTQHKIKTISKCFLLSTYSALLSIYSALLSLTQLLLSLTQLQQCLLSIILLISRLIDHWVLPGAAVVGIANNFYSTLINGFTWISLSWSMPSFNNNYKIYSHWSDLQGQYLFCTSPATINLCTTWTVLLVS